MDSTNPACQYFLNLRERNSPWFPWYSPPNSLPDAPPISSVGALSLPGARSLSGAATGLTPRGCSHFHPITFGL